MVKDGGQKAALLAAKNELLSACSNVHASLGHLIHLVNQSEPRAIADTLGSNAGISLLSTLDRFGQPPSVLNNPQPAAQQHLVSHHPPQNHQVTQNGPSGPSFAGFPPQSRPQFGGQPVKHNNLPAAQESEDEQEYEDEGEPSEEDHHTVPNHAQHTYVATVQPGVKKGRGEKKAKKERDPNAPKRPASAYILFQNAVRKEMRAANPTVDYKELARQIGDRWKNLSEDAKRPWSEAGKRAMSSWNVQNREYKSLHPETIQATSPHTLSTASSTTVAPVKRRRPANTTPTFDAQGNLIKKKRGRPSKADRAEQDLAAGPPVQAHPSHTTSAYPPAKNPSQPSHHAAGPPVTQHNGTARWPETPGHPTHPVAHMNGGAGVANYPGPPHQQLPRPPHPAAAAEEEEEDEEDEEEDAMDADTDSEEGEGVPQTLNGEGVQPPMQAVDSRAQDSGEEEQGEYETDEEEEDEGEEEEEESGDDAAHVQKKIKAHSPPQ